MKKNFKRFISILCVASTLFVVGAAVVPASARKPLVSAYYDSDVADDGFAKGTLTIRTDGWYDLSGEPTDAIAYWANEDGILEGYAAMARFSVTAISTSYRFPDLQIIPEGADRIRVYTAPKNSEFSLTDSYVEAMLGDTATFNINDEPNQIFALVSDTHVVNDDNNTWTKRFKNMLTDITTNVDGVERLFINGDMVNTASGAATTPDRARSEYEKLQSIKDEVCSYLPIHMAIGNHDLWPVGFNSTSLQEMEQMFCQNTELPDGTHPDSFFYDFWLDNNHFVFVGDSGRDPNYLWLDATALNWLDTTIAAGYEEGNNTFIFMHQAMPNTVSGSITELGQMDGLVDNAYEVRQVLKKYPNAVMFSSHSHYSLNSVGNAFNDDPNYPTVFGTSSVANPYNERTKSVFAGSEGYIVEVYDDFILLKGRDFENGLWMPSAQYAVLLNDDVQNVEKEENNKKEEPKEEPKEENKKEETPKATEPKQTEAVAEQPTAVATDTDKVTEPAEASGCGASVGVGALAMAVLGTAVCVTKKKKD